MVLGLGRVLDPGTLASKENSSNELSDEFLYNGNRYSLLLIMLMMESKMFHLYINILKPNLQTPSVSLFLLTVCCGGFKI